MLALQAQFVNETWRLIIIIIFIIILIIIIITTTTIIVVIIIIITFFVYIAAPKVQSPELTDRLVSHLVISKGPIITITLSRCSRSQCILDLMPCAS